MKPTLLDLYCCAGGAGMGYHLAGFDVCGVDISDQPNYPFHFFAGDAIEYLNRHWSMFDAFHASPPCQKPSGPTKGTNAARNAAQGREHPDLVDVTRQALEATGKPYVIENVMGAPLRRDLVLCGEMFGLGVLQHRVFELGRWSTEQPEHIRHRGRVRGWRHGTFYDGPYVAAYGRGGGKATVSEMQKAKEITWSDNHVELCEAIPPAYTKWIGERLLASL